MRLLHRIDREPGLGQVDILAVKLEGFLAKSLAQEVDPFVCDSAGFGEIDAEPAQLIGLVTAAQPDDQTAGGQVVGERDVAQEACGLIQGRQDHGRPELDTHGLWRDMADHHQRRRRHRIIREMMLGEP